MDGVLGVDAVGLLVCDGRGIMFLFMVSRL